MSTYDIVLEEMYAGKQRKIEALEKQLSEMTARAEKAEAREAALRKALQKHHDWHNNQGESTYLEDGETFTIHGAEAYQEGTMFSETDSILYHTTEAAEAYEKRVRAEVLEDIREILSQLGPFTLRDAFEERLAALEAEASTRNCGTSAEDTA